jgi:hypothetical protein
MRPHADPAPPPPAQGGLMLTTPIPRVTPQAAGQKVKQIVNEVRRLVPDTRLPDGHPHRQHPDA